MVKVSIDLGSYTTNKNGTKMFQTRYSNWEQREFDSEEDAIHFAKGVVCGLSYTFKKASVLLSFKDGETICFYS